MSSLVIELRNDCLDANAVVANLLRKALVVAWLLSIPDFDSWIESELNGYLDPESLPPYRVVMTQIEAQDQWGRWIPVIFSDTQTQEMVGKAPIVESIAEIEALLARDRASRPHLMFSPEKEEMLARASQRGLVRHARIIRFEDLLQILDAVKNQILTWCIRLERDGIVGADMTFSKEEQRIAAASHYTTNVHIGTMTQSQIQHGTSVSSQVLQVNTFSPDAMNHVLKEIRKHIDGIGLNATQRKQVEVDTTTVETQVTSPKPNHGVIRDAFRSIRNVLEGTTGSLIAAGLLYEIARLGLLRT